MVVGNCFMKSTDSITITEVDVELWRVHQDLDNLIVATATGVTQSRVSIGVSKVDITVVSGHQHLNNLAVSSSSSLHQSLTETAFDTRGCETFLHMPLVSVPAGRQVPVLQLDIKHRMMNQIVIIFRNKLLFVLTTRSAHDIFNQGAPKLH